MRALFIHQNMPGQFRYLANAVAHMPASETAFITQRKNCELPGVQRVSYTRTQSGLKKPSSSAVPLEHQIANGTAVVEACQALEARGFTPDIIIGHPGWGELLFVKDLYPNTPLISYCEFYFDPNAPFFEGDPPAPLTLPGRMRRHAHSAHLLLSLEAADRGWSPTPWQKSLHPAVFHDKIEVIFDGVDTDRVRPDPLATFELSDGRALSRDDEIITYAARSLEPTRGFPTFARAIPHILARRPKAQILIAGDAQPHYDPPPSAGSTWREAMSQAVTFDPQRVHFLGRLPQERFVRMLQVSMAHVYLTTPAVLSWSLVEAMSAGCLVVASDTPPVRDILVPGDTGLVTSFHDPEQIAADVDAALGHPEGDEIRHSARRLVEDSLSLRHCLPKQIGLIHSVINKSPRQALGA